VLSDLAEDLRTTSDALLRDLEVLNAIEEEKRDLQPGDQRRLELATRIQEIASRLLATSAKQTRLIEVGRSQAEAGTAESPAATINETPARPIVAILADWRAAERRLQAAEPGSAEASEASALSDHLREEYRRAHDARVS
jgi:hypothetical protein